MIGKDEFIKTTMDKITVGVNVVVLKEGDQFVAYCPALNLSAYGKNIELARKRFNEELDIFFEETSIRGTLEKYLLNLGWKLIQRPEPKYYPPDNIQKNFQNSISTFTENVSIPVL